MQIFWPVEGEIGKLDYVDYGLVGLRIAPDYILVEIDGKLYLSEGPQGGEWATLDREELQSPDLLFSVVRLVKEPGEWNWDDLSEVVPLNNIFQWLKRYGMPGYDPSLLYGPRGIRYVYQLSLFERHAATLYLMFRLLEAASYEWEWEKSLNHYYAILSSHPDFDWQSGISHESHMNSWLELPAKNRASSAMFLIHDIIDREVGNIRLKFMQSRPYFYLFSTSLISICYYQFGLLLTRGEFNSKNVKRCKECQSPFWGHGNRLYCPNHDRRRAWEKTEKGRAYQRARKQSPPPSGGSPGRRRRA